MSTSSNKGRVIKPVGVALWLLKDTSLTFDQIADFCGISVLEVSSMQNGNLAKTTPPVSPIVTRQLTQAEIHRCEQNPELSLQLSSSVSDSMKATYIKRNPPKYTSLSARRIKLAAVLWLVQNCPNASSSAIARTAGSTKKTVDSLRDGTHKDFDATVPVSPVSKGLCSQSELEALQALQTSAIAKAKKKITSKK